MIQDLASILSRQSPQSSDLWQDVARKAPCANDPGGGIKGEFINEAEVVRQGDTPPNITFVL
jgi:hypothetical protein